MLGRGNEIVITVDPVREEAKQRQEEVRAAAKNDGSGLREWIVEEAAWLVAQFTKVAMSVAVVRGVHQLFRIGYASESAYQRAPDLWSHGHQQQDRRGGYAHPSGSTGTWRPSGGSTGGSAQSDSFDQRADHMMPTALDMSLPSRATISTFTGSYSIPAGSSGLARFCT